MPVLDRVLETALYVDDLAVSSRFYETVMGLRPMVSGDRMVAYGVGGTVLLLFRRGGSTEPIPAGGGTIPPHDGAGPAHLAFAIAADAAEAWAGRLAEAGVAVESRVTWPRGGVSLYCRDPDGHLVELATPGLWPNY